MIERILTNIYSRFQANPKLAWTVVTLIAAAIVHNYPGLLAFLPKEAQDLIQTEAYNALKYGAIAVAWWAKQHNTAGIGTLDDPTRKPDADGMRSKTL